MNIKMKVAVERTKVVINKLFICVLGGIIGGSGVYVSLTAPELLTQSNTIEIRRPQLHFSEEVSAKEPEVVKRDLVDVIFTLESSRGKNNYSKCEAIGKFNQYGFGILGNGDYLCFEKDQDKVAVTGWVAQKEAQGLTEEEILCLYNTGKATSTCDYSNKAVAIWSK